MSKSKHQAPQAHCPQVRCPSCRKLTEFSPNNRFRPFCSERCKMMDLGAWATEQYRVPAEENDDNIDNNPPSIN